MSCESEAACSSMGEMVLEISGDGVDTTALLEKPLGGVARGASSISTSLALIESSPDRTTSDITREVDATGS